MIGGEWVDSESENYIDGINTATQEVMAKTPDSTKNDVDKAVRAACDAYVEWRQTPILSRVRYLHTYKNVLEDNFEEIAKTVVREGGKTLDEARGEIRRGIESIEFSFGVPSLMT